MFVRIEPENKVGTWGTIANRERKVFKLIFEMFKPSILISPALSSTMRNKDNAIVDFPAPVRPTIPTLFLPGMVHVILFSAFGIPSRYLRQAWSNSISPALGHCFGTDISQASSLFIDSCGILCVKLSTLSTAFIANSSSTDVLMNIFNDRVIKIMFIRAAPARPAPTGTMLMYTPTKATAMRLIISKRKEHHREATKFKK